MSLLVLEILTLKCACTPEESEHKTAIDSKCNCVRHTVRHSRNPDEGKQQRTSQVPIRTDPKLGFTHSWPTYSSRRSSRQHHPHGSLGVHRCINFSSKVLYVLSNMSQLYSTNRVSQCPAPIYMYLQNNGKDLYATYII